MKLKAGILAMIVGLLILQPLFGNFGLREAYGNCSTPRETSPCPSSKSTCPKAKKQCTSKKTCNSPASPGKKKNCDPGGCNPLLGCSSGNFYIHHYSTISLLSLFIPKLKPVMVNDNRIQKRLNECWHPPEII